jgi:hypothetical protein
LDLPVFALVPRVEAPAIFALHPLVALVIFFLALRLKLLPEA